jgi:hypothetical protein
MKAISKICIFSFIEKKDNEEEVKRYRLNFKDGDVSATTFDDSITNEAFDAIVSELDPDVQTDKKGRKYRITRRQMEIDFRPIPRDDGSHHAFINAAIPFVPKARTVDLGI